MTDTPLNSPATTPAESHAPSHVIAPAAHVLPPSAGPLANEDEYRVNLENYSGPLELLLYLIRRDEVDIKDIPIARITEQYLHHVEIISRIDINLAGEFLVMAATLMEIKSRMLIPKLKPTEADANSETSAPTSVEDLADPRYELVTQLLAYKQFKDAASDLQRRAQMEADRYSRATPKQAGRAPLDIEDLDLFRLIDAFNAIMSSLGNSAYGHEVAYDDTPISLHQADILDRLSRETRKFLSLHELFIGRTKKSEMIGLFLATLELIRQKKISVEQPDPLGEIVIRLREDVPEQTLFHEEAPVTRTPTTPQTAAEEPQEITAEDEDDMFLADEDIDDSDDAEPIEED